jgi:hypothetical protein
MSSTIYDNDCSIIKKPVTSDEFEYQIDILQKFIIRNFNEAQKDIELLREENQKLKKEIELLKPKNMFLINPISFDWEDSLVEGTHKEFIKYMKLYTEDVLDEVKILIDLNFGEEVEYYPTPGEFFCGVINVILIPEILTDKALIAYFKRRNLCFIVPHNIIPAPANYPHTSDTGIYLSQFDKYNPPKLRTQVIL